ncbi:MAG: hypothetical protein J7L31_05445 [Thermoplasmata archaeon]|nr:hypothetical protein [Thermoplasmata archaeon]
MKIHPAAISLLIILSILSTSSLSFNRSALYLNIDCSLTEGKIKYFSEINSGPLPIHYIKDGVDITEQYKQIGINFVRTHDFYGPTDISTIFPNWSADVNNPASYNFTSSDEVIESIVNAGCHVFYRLGESASDNEKLRQPPENFTKWAEICKHIVMHYNDGWANGYHYNITYWEIWNEPDLSGFWNGTAEQYYELYRITATTLKNYNASIKVGGPCTSSVTNKNFTTGFLDYVTENDIPLDFFSWHMYSSHPYELQMASLYIRNLLDVYGLKDCENINTEWNVNILSPQRDKDNAKNAAFTACTMMAWQRAGMDYAFRYRGTQDNNWLARLLGFDLSLFAYDGTYKRPALTYLAMNYMVKDTPLMIQTPPFNVSQGIAYLAGIDEKRSNISILVSNYDSPDKTFTINLTNLPWEKSSIIHYLIDEKHHLQIVEERNINGISSNITIPLNKNSVHFIRITSSPVIPAEGPEVAPIPLWMKLRFLDPVTKLLGILLLMLVFG